MPRIRSRQSKRRVTIRTLSHTTGAYPKLTVPRESDDHTSCIFGDVVTLERANDDIDFAVWDRHARCAGSKGIFPSWFQVPSACSGPDDCILLQSGALLYPPDKEVWFPQFNKPDWESTLKPMFSSLPRGEKFDPVREHVTKQKERWGIVR